MLFWCRNKRVVNIPTEILLITPVRFVRPQSSSYRCSTHDIRMSYDRVPCSMIYVVCTRMYVVCTSWAVSQIRKFSIRRSIRYISRVNLHVFNSLYSRLFKLIIHGVYIYIYIYIYIYPYICIYIYIYRGTRGITGYLRREVIALGRFKHIWIVIVLVHIVQYLL